MEELEIKTYNYAVKAIGFAKSIEKEFPDIGISEFKKSSGNVSLKFMDALETKENTDFASLLRKCYSELQKSIKSLKSTPEINNEVLENEKNSLIKSANQLDIDLKAVIDKLIY